MKIDASAVSMLSTRNYYRKETTAFRQTSFLGGLSNFGTLSVSGQGSRGSGQGTVKTSTQLFEKFHGTQNIHALSAQEQFKGLKQIQFESLSYLLRMFLHLPLNGMYGMPAAQSGGISSASGAYQLTEQYAAVEEEENTTFSTTGTVITQDGREITFDLSVGMTRRFEASAYSASISTPDLCDPLVINLDTNITEVSDQKFIFDIDADGVLDTISMTAGGSGFLAVDKNGDGVINDGSELFGTTSGDGFKDLAAYDDDGNGWIDEGDAIWEKLLIWSKDSDGNDKLCAVGEAGVGAIYLGNVSTNFSLNNASSNETNALIRQTGIFLYENGGVGTVQHVDFAKQ